jgi:hypothetical protein
MISSRRHHKKHHTRIRVVNGGGVSGYALPQVPIPVTLARDEEIAAEGEGETCNQTANAAPIAPPPPVYGLWGNSVVRLSKMRFRQVVWNLHKLAVC